MGVEGFLNLMYRKILTNYNDGTFCWGGEGTFYIEQYSKNESLFAKFVRNVYYNSIWMGKYFKQYYYCELALWFGILFWCICNVFSIRKSQVWDSVTLVMLAIIGLTVFEPRARYFYTYAPLYILLAMTGIQSVVKGKIGRYEKNI